ncbi:MAG: patatin-like phospholipase family protein [Candidatus Neomarinimicrobiota bacterium]
MKKISIIILIILIALPLLAFTDYQSNFSLVDYRSDWSLSWENYFKKDQKIGLALGGGSVLGAAHIGVLRALEELDIEIDLIAGTSIGALIAGLYANGVSWQEIETMTEDLRWFDLSAPTLSRLGLLSNRRMGDLIREKIGNVNLEDSKIPVAMIAADIESLKKVILTKGEVAKASMASTCVPGIFSPVEIDNRLLVDGGVVESVPVSPLLDMGAEIIIAVNLNSENKSEKPKSLIQVLLRTFSLSSNVATKFQLSDVDILIAPDLSEFNVVDIDQSPDLIQKGYEEAIKVLKEYFR